MPRTKKNSGKKTTSATRVMPADQQVTTRSTARAGGTNANRNQEEEPPRTTRVATKWKGASGKLSPAKRQHVASTHHESESDTAGDIEVDETPLTRADIPKIVEAVLSNFSQEGTSSTEDNPHLGEHPVARCCSIDERVVTTNVAVVVRLKLRACNNRFK